MSKIVDAWILMWGLSYLICAFVKPDIFADRSLIYGFISMALIGSLMLFGLIFSKKTSGKIVLFVTGILETLSGVSSWSGSVTWNVPFQEKAIFNVTMALLDLLGAAALFTKALENDLNIELENSYKTLQRVLKSI